MNDTLKLCYWMQGFIEIVNRTPTAKQWKEIRTRIEQCDLYDQSGDGSMTAETFMTWIKGFIELAEPTSLTTQQWNVIKEHLQLVFTKVTIETVDDDDDGVDPEAWKEFKKLIEEKKDSPNPWKNPDPYKPAPPYIAPITPFNPGEVICGTDQSNMPDTFCCNTQIACATTTNLDKDADVTGSTAHLDDNAQITPTSKPRRSKRLCSSPSKKTYCASTSKAHAMYLADPVN